MSDKNQRVRIYRLTASGRKRLTTERSKWELLSAAIAGVLSPQREGET
jgi:DNA-binding PadR family transcriptional regulator